MRADARRNRSAVLAAAQALITVDGVDFTMDALAERAGVAVGTLYRHYPTKTALVSAVLDQSVEAIASIANDGWRAVQAGADAGATLDEVFARIAAAYTSDAAVKHAAASLGVQTGIDDLTAQPDGPAARASVAMQGLLAEAQRTGHTRADLTLADLIMLVGSVPGATPDGHARDRYIEIVLAGTRAAAPDAGNPRR